MVRTGAARERVDDLLVLGIDWRTDDLIVPPIGLADALDSIKAEDPRRVYAPTSPVSPVFGLVERDPFDPHEVGWVVIVGADDPDREEISSALEPLALTRGEPTTWGPILYSSDTDVRTWMEVSFNRLDPMPQFVLLAGSPAHLPFALQSSLASLAYVGRLDFSTVSDGVEHQHPDLFGAYVDKVLRNERGDIQPADMEVVVWATSHGPRDPTFYSRHVMAGPLADRIEVRKRYRVSRLFDDDATPDGLFGAIAGRRPALVFTASHGDAVPATAGVDVQAAHNGAMVGQDLKRLGANLLPPADTPFVEGGLIFQFACFGYGTPAVSGYTHWSGSIAAYQAPFELVSALPKAAIAHPRGPIGFIAHADYALLHAFMEPSEPEGDGAVPTGPRMAGFRGSIDDALLAVPIGAVLKPMSGQLSLLNAQLTDVWDQVHAAGQDLEVTRELVDAFLRRNDARYYFLLGDPAARPRIDDTTHQ